MAINVSKEYNKNRMDELVESFDITQVSITAESLEIFPTLVQEDIKIKTPLLL